MGGIFISNDRYESLVTESVNPATSGIDSCSTLEMLTLINDQDQAVPNAVRAQLPQIAQAVDLIVDRLQRGGRLIYVGAGTSGRLGVLDASECPPTFSTPPELVQAYIAGGDVALRTAVEGCEDDADAGAALAASLSLTERDVLVGITASGTAPYVLGAVRRAKEAGAATVALVNNEDAPLSRLCDVTIAPVVGPEVILGSTRMKSGTAQKLVLNMLSTGSMIRLGKVYGNLMVDVHVSNRKLYDRAVRIVARAAQVDRAAAQAALEAAGRNVKAAILMLETGLDLEAARQALERCGGSLARAIQSAKAGP